MLLNGISALSAGVLIVTASPASADSVRSAGTGSSALVVEKATGVVDVTKPVVEGSFAAKAVTGAGEGSVTVIMPPTAEGRIEAKASSGDAVSLTLQGASESATAMTSESGTVVYKDVAHATDLAVQATSDGGVRTLVTLKDSTASQEQRFPLVLGDDVRLVDDGDGGYLLARQEVDGIGEVIATVDAPWAKDATGRPIDTSYRLEGNTLVQTVQTSEDTTFPVVADPKITFGVGAYFNAWGYEWKSYAIAAGSVGYFANLAGCSVLDKIPHIGLKRAATAICSAVGYKTVKDWGAFLRSQIKDKSLHAGTCYQTKILPRNSKLTKVSSGNCK
ncbi:hypothetical protein [Streptomyces sp. DH12]|uniref:hypothetical protein n=1 Tax=Streptomyces sp. DH12 TaxID=2857010 RepID=UPI001E4CD383|nr:hypothetical protein [Streptomyces sp. DH12]